MAAVDAFARVAGNLVRCGLGRTVTNLRELFDEVRRAPDGAIEHHMMPCALEDHPERCGFPNDQDRIALGSEVLGEGSLLRLTTNRMCRKENRSRQFYENRHLHDYLMMLLGIDPQAPNVLVA